MQGHSQLYNKLLGYKRVPMKIFPLLALFFNYKANIVLKQGNNKGNTAYHLLKIAFPSKP